MPEIDGPRRGRGRKYHRVDIRVSSWEWERIHSLAAESGLSITEYILSSTVYAAVVTGQNTSDLREIYSELRSQGINLNQAMRVANMLLKGGDRVGAQRAIEDISSMKEALTRSLRDASAALSAARPRRFFPEAASRDGADGGREDEAW